MALYDIAAFDELITEAAQTAQLSSADLITGTPKLAQRFLLILLTEQGTLVYTPTAGCTFLIAMFSGQWRSSADVLQSFYYALLDIQRQLAAMQLPDDPADEVFAGVTVVNLTLTDTKVALTIQITSQAGTQQTVTATINVVV
jgi:hypothetical protein